MLPLAQRLSTRRGQRAVMFSPFGRFKRILIPGSATSAGLAADRSWGLLGIH